MSELINMVIKAINEQDDWTDVGSIANKAEILKRILGDVLRATDRINEERVRTDQRGLLLFILYGLTSNNINNWIG